MKMMKQLSIRMLSVVLILLFEIHVNSYVTTSGFKARSSRLCKLFAGGFGKSANLDDFQYVKADPEALCKCGSSLLYKECCLSVHDAGGSDDPVKVVRSRFSALCYGFIEHMIKTTDPSHKEYIPKEKGTKYKKYYKDIQKYSTEFDFLELKFEENTPVEYDEKHGNAYVSFNVKLQRKLDGRKPEILGEKSTFKRDSKDRFWLYVGGELKGMKGSTESERKVDLSSVNRDGKNSAIALGTQRK